MHLQGNFPYVACMLSIQVVHGCRPSQRQYLAKRGQEGQLTTTQKLNQTQKRLHQAALTAGGPQIQQANKMRDLILVGSYASFWLQISSLASR